MSISVDVSLLGKILTDDILIFLLFFAESKSYHFMQIVSSVDTFYIMSTPVFLENKKKISRFVCRVCLEHGKD